MGLSAYSNPADAGILCMILVQTAMSISFMKENLLSILQVVRIRIASWEEYSDQPATEPPERGTSRAYMDEFRSMVPTLRYDSLSCNARQECSVCLMEFKPAAEINRLSCGHVFHKSCLEKWLDYWNITCPLCRNRMIALIETQENTCPMFAPTEAVLLFPNSERLDPTEALLRWWRHLKEPGWLVGAHMQLTLAADDFLLGDVDAAFVSFMLSSRDRSCISIFRRAAMILSSDVFFDMFFKKVEIETREDKPIRLDEQSECFRNMLY